MSQSVEQMTWEELAGVHVSPQTAELDYLLEWIERCPVLQLGTVQRSVGFTG